MKDNEWGSAFEQIFEYSLNEIYIFDSESLLFSLANKAARDNIGYLTNELQTITPRHLILGDSLDEFERCLSLLREKKETRIKLDSEFTRKEGSKYPVEMYLQCCTWNGADAIVATVIDSTEKFDFQEKLGDSERFFESVIENIPNMIFIKESSELRFVRMNKAGEELLGVGRDSLLGKNDYDFFPKEQADFFIAKDRETLRSGKMLDIPEEPIDTVTHGERFLHTKKIPILDEEGVPRYLLGISEDVTERREAIEALRESQR